MKDLADATQQEAISTASRPTNLATSPTSLESVELMAVFQSDHLNRLLTSPLFTEQWDEHVERWREIDPILTTARQSRLKTCMADIEHGYVVWDSDGNHRYVAVGLVVVCELMLNLQPHFTSFFSLVLVAKYARDRATASNGVSTS